MSFDLNKLKCFKCVPSPGAPSCYPMYSSRTATCL